MPPILSMSMWTSLSNEERNKIRVLFAIPRSRSVEVHDGHIVTDGTTPDDFKALSVEKMQVYLGDDSTDFHKLFDKVVAKVTEELMKKPETAVIEVDIPKVMTIPEGILNPLVVEKKKPGRPKKNAHEENK